MRPGRALGKTIQAEHADVDGLVYASRLTSEDVYAIYGRSVAKLKAGDVGRPEEHVDLPGVLGSPRDRTLGLTLWGVVRPSATASWR